MEMNDNIMLDTRRLEKGIKTEKKFLNDLYACKRFYDKLADDLGVKLGWHGEDYSLNWQSQHDTLRARLLLPTAQKLSPHYLSTDDLTLGNAVYFDDLVFEVAGKYRCELESILANIFSTDLAAVVDRAALTETLEDGDSLEKIPDLDYIGAGKWCFVDFLDRGSSLKKGDYEDGFRIWHLEHDMSDHAKFNKGMKETITQYASQYDQIMKDAVARAEARENNVGRIGFGTVQILAVYSKL